MRKKDLTPENKNMENHPKLIINGMPVKIHSTGLIKYEEIHPVQFEKYFYSMFIKSKSKYYNPVNFRHNLDPSFWRDLLDRYYKF